jgi:hypothetical protein
MRKTEMGLLEADKLARLEAWSPVEMPAVLIDGAAPWQFV